MRGGGILMEEKRKNETSKEYMTRLFAIYDKEAKAKTKKANEIFLNRWLPKGSYLRQRFDEVNNKQTR